MKTHQNANVRSDAQESAVVGAKAQCHKKFAVLGRMPSPVVQLFLSTVVLLVSTSHCPAVLGPHYGNYSKSGGCLELLMSKAGN